MKKHILTQIYANRTQINADDFPLKKSATICVPACRQTGNLRESAFKKDFPEVSKKG